MVDSIFENRMSEIKLCRDCKHRKGQLGSQFYKCIAPQNQEINCVSGYIGVKHLTYCCGLRRDSWLCGPKGGWFEPKDSRSLWTRLCDFLTI